ncbi:tetratricopeptide repeat protein [Streptomyces sp. NPDC002928]|uniref:tetratricopeptide repeat protein n=1 Tax=Streptomyces sp. NPDC002928 TaxID=3154440 RepID=UPI0033B4E8AB
MRLTVHGSGNRIDVAPKARIEDVHIHMRGSGHRLVIGEECSIMGGELWFEDYGCLISIGRRTSIQSAHLAATEPGSAIEIGTDCMFAYDIDVRTGDSHSILDPDTGLRLNHAQNVTIGDGVWIAAHVSVLKGAVVGTGSVIATRSVVTHEVPPQALVAGAPAVVIRAPVRWIRSRLPNPPAPQPPLTADMATSWFDRAMALREVGEPSAAADAFRTAASLRPGHVDTHYHLALALSEDDRQVEALAEYDLAVAKRGSKSWMWFDRGVCLARLGRHQEALRSFHQALRMRPDYRQAWFETSRSHACLGHHEKAVDSMVRAVRLHPDYLARVRDDEDLKPLSEDVLRQLGSD